MRINYEERIISAVVNNNDLIPLVTSLVEPGDLATVGLSQVYSRILQQFRESGYINYVWVVDNLSGSYEVSNLTNGAWTEEQTRENCLRVRSDRQKRDLAHLATTLLDASKNTTAKTSDIVAATTSQLFKIASSGKGFDTVVKFSDMADVFEEDRAMFKDRTLLGYSTGFPTLDTITKGLQSKTLWIIGGYTSYGKSWFCLDLAFKSMKQGARVLYISLEMSAKKTAWRLASLALNLSEYDMVTDRLTQEDRIRVSEFMQKLRGADYPLWISDSVTTNDDIFYKVLEMKSRYDVDVVVIDYIQNIHVKGKEEYEALTVVARDLQRLAVSQGLVLIVASQNNRESLKGGKGFGYHGSSQIEKAADIGVVLDKPEDENGGLIFNVAKNRNGLTGAMKVYTDFEKGVISDGGLYVY